MHSTVGSRLQAAWGPKISDSAPVSRLGVFDENLVPNVRKAPAMPSKVRSGADESFVERVTGASPRQATSTPGKVRGSGDESFAELVAAARLAASTPGRTHDSSRTEFIGAAASSRHATHTPVRRLASDDVSPIAQVSSPSSSCILRSSSARSGGPRRLLDESARSSLSTSRRVLSEINSKARFEALHRDSECRKMRREVAERERDQRLDEEAKQLQNVRPTPQRPWGRQWAKEQSAAYLKKLKALEAKRQQEHSTKEEEELRECSFAPIFYSKEVPRQRRMLKAKQELEALAERQRDWTQRLDGLLCEESDLYQSMEEDYTQGLQRDELSLLAQQRAVAGRRCRIGILQVLHELALLEAEALSIASRATRSTTPHRGSNPVPVLATAATASLAELCPSFDLELLPALRSEVPDLEAPLDSECAWEVPGTILCPIFPVPAPPTPSNISRGTTPDEAKQWAWS